MRYPWKVLPGFSTGRGGLTFDNAGTGIRARSFASYEAARDAAVAMVTLDDDLCYFAAARLYGSVTATDWPIGEVEEYVHTDDDGYRVETIDLLERAAGLASAGA